jgi:hypothetical protein
VSDELDEAIEVSELLMAVLRKRNPSIGSVVIAISTILVTIVAEFSNGNLEAADGGIDAIAEDMKDNIRVLFGEMELSQTTTRLQ